jgi:hypothetical protein
MSKPESAGYQKELDLPRLCRRVKWPSLGAFLLAVFGYFPYNIALLYWVKYIPWANHALNSALESTGRKHLLLAWYWALFPLTTVSIPFAALGLVRIRRYGARLAGEGANIFLMWAWLGCASALLLAVLRALQIVCFGQWSILI